MDRIHVLDQPDGSGSDVLLVEFPPPHLKIKPGEVAEYLSEFSRAVGGDVTLDRRRHTSKVEIFAGSRATKTQAVKLC